MPRNDISYKTYENRSVQSLTGHEGGIDQSLGMMKGGKDGEPREYSFGVAKRCEQIEVLFGALQDPRTGEEYHSGSSADIMIFNVGDDIKIVCLTPLAGYHCVYV